ncbi:MAG TPA: hypothetical protein VJ996_04935 [Solirubrobacteraceae bacterium]|nr:hypothetical protein [Solirubrobacteraceae bacterium]
MAADVRESAGEGCNEGCAEQERSARARTQPTMRVSGLSSGLESALGEYAQAAAHLLHADIVAGAEVELELGSRRGRAQTAFYSCRPLTERFIAEREAQLQRLPEHDPAVSALAGFDGLDRYLAGRAGVGGRGREGEGGGRSARGDDVLKSGVRAGAHARARSALRCLLDDVFAEQTEFELRPERLVAALVRLERAELTSAPDTVTLVATLHGLTIGAPEIKLTRGLTIATPQALRWAPEQALAATAEEGEAGHLLVALTCEEPAGGREVLRDLLRALRLFGDGRVALGSLAWARAGGQDAWSAIALGTGGRPHGMLVVSPEQEDELRAFCNLVSRRAPDGNEIAWALRRFELGCERASPYEALSDHLLALRALLEGEGPSSGMLAGRIAALCATPENRARLTERMVKAQKLERAVIAGTAAERAAAVAIARDVADHLRALLRDVICGHLTEDLARLADELLAAPTDPRVEQAADAAHAVESEQGQQILVEA